MPNNKKSIAPLVDSPAPRSQIVMPKTKSILRQGSVAPRQKPPFDVDKMKSITKLS